MNMVTISDGVVDIIFKVVNGEITLTSTPFENSSVELDFTYDSFTSMMHKEREYKPQKIIKNPVKCATTVKWEDGTYTTVKCSPDDPEDDYAAFTAALAIKVYGSNSAIKRMMNKKTETLKKKEKKYEES